MEATRRSSRSTKGKHSRLYDDYEVREIPASILPPESEHEEEEDEEVDDSVNCVCVAHAYNKKKDLGTMAECEKCLKWQHISCLFGKDDDTLLPEQYTCHVCSPHLYEDILGQATDSGQAEPRAKKRKSDHTTTSADPDPYSYEESKRRSKSASPVEPVNSKPRGPTVPQKHKVRVSVIKAFTDIIVPIAEQLATEGNLPQCENQASVREYAYSVSLKLEEALYDTLAVKPSARSKSTATTLDVGPKYRDKFRTISFNLKDPKNPHFKTQVVSGAIDPRNIVRLSGEEMLSPELQKLAESVRAESIRESILIADEKPRIRKTHKGEEIVGETEIDQLQPETVSDRSVSPVSACDHSLSRENHQQDHHKKLFSPPASPYTVLETNEDSDHGASKLDLEDTDLDEIVNSTNSPGKRTAGSKESSNAARLSTIWTGHVSMAPLVELRGQAAHLHSKTIAPTRSGWNTALDLSKSLVIDGRLDKVRASKYLTAVGETREIASFVLQPLSDSQSQAGLKELFEYFHSRGKFGVIQNTVKDSVKDAYLVTLEVHDDVPAFLRLSAERLDALERVRRETYSVILCVFVMQQKQRNPPANTKPSPSDTLKQLLEPLIAQPGLPAQVLAPPELPAHPVVTPPQFLVGVSPEAMELLKSLGLDTDQFDKLRGQLTQNPAMIHDPQQMLSFIQGL